MQEGGDRKMHGDSDDPQSPRQSKRIKRPPWDRKTALRPNEPPLGLTEQRLEHQLEVEEARFQEKRALSELADEENSRKKSAPFKSNSDE